MCSFQFLGYDKKTFNIEKFYMDTLNKEYNNYHFKQISSIISEIENNVFLSIIQRKSIINLYYKNLRLKWLLTKKIIRYRNSNIEKEPINKYLLDLTSSLEPSSKYIDVLINKNKFHRFTINEMIQLFEFSLYSQEEGIPNPSIPNNPYTGNSFTLLEMIHIFNIIKQQNQELPLVMSMFKHYLAFNKIQDYKTHLNSVWVNEMKQHEYNPTHIHRGMLFTGLSSVMILKMPSTFGREYSADQVPQNGRLQILGASNGQFSKIDYQPPMDLRDFYIFPYDMRHCVYPFNGTDETRRTLAANCDVQFDPIKNRGAV